MKSLLAFLALAAGLLLAGCTTSATLNKVRVGMTKSDVIALLGQPDSTSAQANVEYLTYYLTTFAAERSYDYERPYMVRLVDGRVESFGRFAQLWDLYDRPPTLGGTASAPQVSMPAASSPPANDVATQLERLKSLKDQGVLSEEEFEKAKAKLLSSN